MKKTRVAPGKPTERTVTIGGLYERRSAGATKEHRFFVYGDGEPVTEVVYREQGPTEETHLLGRDGHGSVGLVFSDDGITVYERLYYEPFGGRTDVAGAPVGASAMGVPWGFTGHHEDDDLGLIAMKGRVYDPVLRRFLSPDPIVHDVLAGQTLNHYSYVWNNPLRYVDPSGLDGEGADPSGVSPEMGAVEGTAIDTEVAVDLDVADEASDLLPGARSLKSTSEPQTDEGSQAPPLPAPTTSSDAHPTERLYNPYGLPMVVVDMPAGPGTEDPFGVAPTRTVPVLGGPTPLEQLIAGDPSGGRSGYTYLQETSVSGDILSQIWPRDWCFLRPSWSAQSPGEAARTRILVTAAITTVTFVVPEIAGPAAGAGAAASGGERAASSYVYQLVDDAGDAVYYGVSNNPIVRLGRHGLQPPGPFRGMQIISQPLPRAQAFALETSLIQQAQTEGRTIYNVAGTSISPSLPIQVPPKIVPTQTLLNPALYPR